jgi:MFS family permease
MNENNYTKYRWYVLVALIVANIIQGMLLISPTPLVGEIAKSMNMDLGSATASAMLPFTLMVAIGGILSGFVMDKIGLAKTFISSTVIIVISSFLMPVLGVTSSGFAILRGIQGLACSPINASGPRVAAEWFPKNQRAMIQGFMSAAFTFGITIGFTVSPAIAAAVGWNVALSRIGVLFIVSVIMFVIMAFGPKSPAVLEESSTPDNADADIKKVFGLPTFWMTLLAFFFLSWVSQGYNDLTPGHIAVPVPVGLGLGAQVAGRLMSTYTLAFVVGSLVSGFFLQKIFRGNSKRGITATYILTAIFSGSVMLPTVASNISILTVCLVLAGFFMGMPGPFTFGFVASQYPAHITGRVGGIIAGMGIFGGTIAVAVGSYALHATGAYTVSIMIVVCVCVLGATAGFGVNRPNLENERNVTENILFENDLQQR